MGKNINEIDDTNVILNDKYITYPVLFRFCIPKVLPATFPSKLISMQKLRRFLIIGQR